MTLSTFRGWALLVLTLLAGPVLAQRLAAGSGHSLVIHPDGTLWSWGADDSGQLGDGSYSTQPTPAQAGTASNWASLAAGFYSSAGIRADGTLWTWGNNGYGQLGNGVNYSSSVPVQVGSSAWKSVSISYYHTVAVRQDGTLWAWGNNQYGQLGDGTVADHNTPAQVGTATTWVSASAGLSTGLAVRADGTLWAWGSNGNGQLGDGTTTNRLAPVQVGTATTWQSVCAGNNFTLAIRRDGTLWAWGYNAFGQLGLGTSSNTAYQLTPAQVGTATTWASVATGANHSAALRRDGTLWTWGSNTYGQLGLGTSSTGFQLTPAQVGTATTWTSLAAGDYHTLAQRADNSLYAWGLNQSAQLGNGFPSNPTLTQVTNYPGPTGWTRAAAGYYTSFAQQTGNTLWAWGRGSDGQLGLSSYSDFAFPLQTNPATATWLSTAAGYYHALGVRPNGTLWAWGSNSMGQLGGGNASSQSSPLQIGTATTWKSVAAGFVYSVALRTDGTLWSWGDNSLAQLGDPTAGQLRATPGQVGTATNWQSVAAGYSHTLAIKTDGTLWSWGQNFSGQVGNGSAGGYQLTPAQVGSATTWASAAAGPFFSVAVRRDGTLWAWGDNTYGQLGDGTTTPRNLPAQVGTATNWASVALGYGHVVALKADGTLWTWGYNNYGQLGTGTTANRLLPQQVGTDTWLSVSAGSYHTVAVRTSGTLWSCGLNDRGQLAQTLFFAVPTLVPNGGAVLAATAASAAPVWALVPNPAHGRVQLTGLSGPVAVRLFDTQGRLVRTAASAEVELAGLAPGLYLLQATAGPATHTQRLVVE